MKLLGKVMWRVTLLAWVSFFLTACGSGNEQGFKEAVDVNQLNITEVLLVSDNERVRVGESEQFTAYGVVAGGDERLDITSSVSWSSSDSTIVTVDMNGAATGIANGTVDIIASISDLSGSKSLRSSNAALVSISISNQPDSIPVCQTITDNLVATGTYADGDQALITDKVDWVSSNTDVVLVGNEDLDNSSRLAKGVLSGLSIGSSSITASQEDVDSNALSLSVTSGLNSVFLSSLADSYFAETEHQFSAFGEYESGQVEITENVLWSSTDATVLGFSETNIGLAELLISGFSDISAICDPGGEGEVSSGSLTIGVEEPVTVSSLRVVYDGESYENERTITLDLNDSPVQLELNTVDSAGRQNSTDLADEDETTWTVIGSPLSGEAPSISETGLVEFDVVGESEYQVRYKDDDEGINVLIGFFIKVE